LELQFGATSITWKSQSIPCSQFENHNFQEIFPKLKVANNLGLAHKRMDHMVSAAYRSYDKAIPISEADDKKKYVKNAKTLQGEAKQWIDTSGTVPPPPGGK
jgi:hypothetical protein